MFFFFLFRLVNIVFFTVSFTNVKTLNLVASSVSASAANLPTGTPDEIFHCSITGEIFEDPVITVDGQTYERSAIQQWIDTPRGFDSWSGNYLPPTSPLTGLPLKDVTLVENHALRRAISTLQEMKAVSSTTTSEDFSLNLLELEEKTLDMQRYLKQQYAAHTKFLRLELAKSRRQEEFDNIHFVENAEKIEALEEENITLKRRMDEIKEENDKIRKENKRLNEKLKSSIALEEQKQQQEQLKVDLMRKHESETRSMRLEIRKLQGEEVKYMEKLNDSQKKMEDLEEDKITLQKIIRELKS